MESPKDQGLKYVNKVFLWSAPRCLSTAFERAIINLKGGKFFHEPFVPVYFSGPQRKSRRYLHEAVRATATRENVCLNLMTGYKGADFIFCKELAYQLAGNYDALLQKGLKEYKHSFLIRDPKKSIPSLYRGSINRQESGWGYFDPEEVGFRQLLELYEFVVRELDSSPVIVDADDLLESPEEMMKKYCSATGLVYEENMTTWERGPVSELDNCQSMGWHEEVVNSMGIGKVVKRNTECCPIRVGDEKEVNDSIKDSLRHYQVLYERRLRL